MKKIYELPGNRFHSGVIKLRTPITIVDDVADTKILVCGKHGYYYRHRPNYYTQDEYDYRCVTLVSPDKHGARYDRNADGIPYVYFAYGYEGCVKFMIGMESTDEELYAARKCHELNRARHLSQMSKNNAKYRGKTK